MQQFSYLIQNKSIRRAAVVVGLIVATIVVYSLVQVIGRIGKIPVELVYAPFTASIFIDGENGYKNNDTNYLSVGEHEITVYEAGFELYTATIQITEETTTLTGALSALTEEGQKIASERSADYSALDGIESDILSQETTEQVSKWPIMSYLPITNSVYGIGYQLSDSGEDITLTITATEPYIDDAVNELRSLDESISLAEYNFRINDFNNILAVDNFKDNAASNPVKFLADGYSGVNEEVIVNAGKRDGNYYYTTIAVGAYAGYIPVTYRVVLEKDGDSWKLAGTPYPLLTTTNTPGVEQSVLDKVNQLDSPITNTSKTSS